MIPDKLKPGDEVRIVVPARSVSDIILCIEDDS